MDHNHHIMDKKSFKVLSETNPYIFPSPLRERLHTNAPPVIIHSDKNSFMSARFNVSELNASFFRMCHIIVDMKSMHDEIFSFALHEQGLSLREVTNYSPTTLMQLPCCLLSPCNFF